MTTLLRFIRMNIAADSAAIATAAATYGFANTAVLFATCAFVANLDASLNSL